MTKQFNDLVSKYMETLELYVPVVARVHGGSHPEFHEVHQLFNSLKEAIKENADLDPVFKSLREVTSNYAIPAETCESYEAVYNMLAELDSSYSV